MKAFGTYFTGSILTKKKAWGSSWYIPDDLEKNGFRKSVIDWLRHTSGLGNLQKSNLKRKEVYLIMSD
jgi:hypothetical protein